MNQDLNVDRESVVGGDGTSRSSGASIGGRESHLSANTPDASVTADSASTADSANTADTAANAAMRPSRFRFLWESKRAAGDAASALREHAGLRQNRALLLDLAYEEYCARRDRGETIDRSLYCRQFPSISRTLYRQLEVEEYVREHPELIGGIGTAKWPVRGQQLLGFVVVEEIGRGAFARVYLCAQPGMGNRQVVVKVSQGGAPEANTMGGLDHPNIMAVYSVDEDSQTGLTAICMPFVGRSTLCDVIDVAFGQGARPARTGVILEASRGLARRGDRYHESPVISAMRPKAPYLTGVLQLGSQIALGLAHAHDRGVIHADLKPSNIVMSVTARPLIVDFNLAHRRDADNLLTGGTLPYMAPEQIRTMLLGADETDRIDQRADIFSWGVILYELLTGESPFGDLDPDEEPAGIAGQLLDRQHRGDRSLERLLGRVDQGIVELLGRCIQFDPEERPASMDEVVDVLRRHLALLPSLRRAVTLDRRLLLSATAGSLLAVSAGGLALALRPPRRDRLFTAGVEAYHDERYAEASDLFRQAVAVDPRFGEAYLGRACAAMRQFEVDQYQGWLDSAFTDVTLAIRYSNRHPDALAARAYCLILKEQLEMAAQEYDLLVDSEIDPLASRTNFAYCLMGAPNSMSSSSSASKSLADYDRARELLESVIEKSPNCWQAHFNLAMLELKYRYVAPGSDYVPHRGLLAMREVVRLNPYDAATFFVAARLAAIVAAAENDAAIQSECIEYCEQAFNLGHDFDSKLIREGHPFYFIRNDARFLAMLNRASLRRKPTSANPVVVPSVLSSSFALR